MSFDWIALIYLRNMFLMLLVAGGLHLYFYVFRVQGDERRYDTRRFPKDSSKFTFRSQVWDNMFWSLASGVTIWTAYEALMLWAMANGYVPELSMPGDWIWLGLMVFIIPLWETVHFFSNTSFDPLITLVSTYTRIALPQYECRSMVGNVHASD